MARQPATRKALKVRCAIDGPPGAGKTYGALLFARGLVGPEGKIGVIDTERGRCEQYAPMDESEAGIAGIGRFVTDNLAPPFSPAKYIAAINESIEAGDDVLIIDSLTHAWAGTGGVLQAVNEAAGINSFTKWAKPSIAHQALIDAIVQAPMHVIATMRSKMAYELVENDKGKKEPVRLGLAPVQREGTEYEFDIVLDIDQQTHRASLGKCNTSYAAMLAVELEERPVITGATGQAVARAISGAPEPSAEDKARQATRDFIHEHFAGEAFTIQREGFLTRLTGCQEVGNIREVYKLAKAASVR